MPARRISDSDVERILAMRERGDQLHAIADVIGCSKSTVERYCLRFAAEPPKPSRRPFYRIVGPAVMTRNGFPVRRFTPEEDAQLLALEAEGKMPAEIGRALGRQRHSVNARLMTLARREARMEASA